MANVEGSANTMSMIGRVVGWLLVITLAAGISATVYCAAFQSMRFGPSLISAEVTALHILQQAGAATYVAADACNKAAHRYKLLIDVLMLCFALYESLHLAKAAWRAYRLGCRVRSNPILRGARLVFMLAICIGCVGHYTLETMPIPEISDVI
jgi:hypothetical protein